METMEPVEESGVGKLLRDEREKKGLNRDQVARITRLRKQYIEALENEEWEKLPSPVFVKGFIRSFAQCVGFDWQEAVRLYEATLSADKGVPKPLVEPKESKTGLIYFLIPLIAVLAFVVYLYSGYFSPPFEAKKSISLSPENEATEGKIPEKHDLESGKPEPEKEIGAPGQQKPDRKPEAAVKQKADSQFEATVEPATILHEEELPPAPVQEEKSAPELETPAGTGRLVLMAIVRMRTYVKIWVDNNSPKEYIFQPGSRPQWTAREGFEVVVGNAAGIEFDFNGERKGNLGDLGKVVRIAFPDTFRSPFHED